MSQKSESPPGRAAGSIDLSVGADDLAQNAKERQAKSAAARIIPAGHRFRRPAPPRRPAFSVRISARSGFEPHGQSKPFSLDEVALQDLLLIAELLEAWRP